MLFSATISNFGPAFEHRRHARPHWSLDLAVCKHRRRRIRPRLHPLAAVNLFARLPSRRHTIPRSLTEYQIFPSTSGVGTSGPLLNFHSRFDLVMSPCPPALNACNGRSRVGANTIPSLIHGRCDGAIRAVVGRIESGHAPHLFAGFQIMPVTTSPPSTMSCVSSPFFAIVGVE